MESGSPFITSGKVVKNCKKEPKVGDGFENNPWSVEDASTFLKYCCPECDYQILNLEMFSRHALQNHTKSKLLFRIEKYEEKVTNYEEIVTNFEEIVTNYENNLEIQTASDFPLQSEEMETDPFVKNYKIQLPDSKANDVENNRIFHQEPRKPIIKKCKISNVPKGKKKNGVKTVRPRKQSIDEEFELVKQQCGRHKIPRMAMMLSIPKSSIDARIKEEGITFSKKLAKCVFCNMEKKCKICSAQFSKWTLLNQHMFDMHKETIQKIEKCELCFSEFASKKVLILHKLHTHQVGKDKCCVYCDFKHASWLKLGNHIDSFHPEYAEPTYFCQICGKGFIFEENWQYHETHLHKTNRCNVCKIDCLDRDGLKAHFLQKHKFEKSFEEEVENCDLCLFEVSSKGLLEKHLKEKHQSGKKKCCPYCDFKSSGGWPDLKYHIDYHHPKNGDKKHFCDTCNEGFIYKESVKLHKNSKHQKHVCHICGMEYSAKMNLKEHMLKNHKNESETKNWICETCAYSAPTKKSLNAHITVKHAIDKHENCPICEYHAPDMKHIHVHIDSKHPEHDKKTFVCNHCPRSFIFEASLKKHLENQRTMAKNRAKKINLGLMQRNRRKKYGDHYLNQPDNPTNDIQTKTIETGTYNLINRPSGSCISLK